ncbi:MAG: hypothetical protein CMH59_26015 [Myxococcales bacterium]|nr:hypothetical protein [Myxococcales bacterium]
MVLIGACDRGGLVLDTPPQVVESSPGPDEREVGRRPLYRVRWDRRLSPASVTRATVEVRSGPQRRFLSVRFDPVRSELIARDFGDGVLAPRVEYTLRVEGVRDLDGVPAEPFEVRFWTGEAEPEPLLETGVTGWAEVAPLLASRCADAGCHGGPEPALGLDLGSAEGVRETALGVAAVQTGGRVGYPDRGLGGFPRIDVTAGGGRPSTSYLVYKLLGDPHAWGEPMPLGEPPLEEAEIDLVADWILAGAPTE